MWRGPWEGSDGDGSVGWSVCPSLMGDHMLDRPLACLLQGSVIPGMPLIKSLCREGKKAQDL